jgi:hypothetical protein
VSEIHWDEDGIRKAAQAATQRGAERQVAEIERLTSGIRCSVHGTTPVYIGPWPSIGFEDFCCDDLKQRVLTALSGVPWLHLDPAP